MEKWSGKIAVVTGASSGIGEEVVKYFANVGIDVIGLARRSKKVEEIAKKCGNISGKIYAHKCDVSDLQSIKDAFKWIEDKFGSISILVNNAGVAHTMELLGEPEIAENLNSMLSTNFTGLVHCSREAVRLIRKSNDYGIVINISSVLGHSIPFIGYRKFHAYAPSKFAVTAVSEVLRQELIIQSNDKIRVSNLSPGLVRTEMTAPDQNADKYFATVAVLRPEDVAQAISFLLATPYNVNITELTIKPAGEKF